MGALHDWLADRHRVRLARGLQRTTAVRTGSAPEQFPGRPVLDLASNDYLGLAGDPRLKAAAVAAVERYGAGARPPGW